MPDDAPQTGQRPGWPVNLHFNEAGPVFHEPCDTCADFECRPGVWYPTDPKALAKMRETVRLALWNNWSESSSHRMAENVMQALGLTPPEPKEGGAS